MSVTWDDTVSAGDFGKHTWANDLIAAIKRRGPSFVVSRDTYGDYYCDGTADDVQIELAIAAAHATGGGTVLLKEGTYNIATSLNDARVAYTNVDLLGEGWGTIIKADNGLNSNIIDISNLVNCSIRNIQFEGNKANQTSQSANILEEESVGSVSNLLVDRCYFKSAYRHGISVYGPAIIQNSYFNDNGTLGEVPSEGTGVFVRGGSMGVHILNNRITDSEDHAIYTYGQRSLIQGNIIYGNADTAIKMTRDSTDPYGCYNRIIGNHIIMGPIHLMGDCHHNLVVGNTLDGTGTGAGVHGITLSDAHDCTVSGNVAFNWTASGILISTNHNIVTGNVCYGNAVTGIYLDDAYYCAVSANTCTNNGTVGGSYDHGIQLRNSSYCTVAGNNCCDNQGTKTQDYGFREEGTSDYNVYKGNVSQGNEDYVYAFLGTHNSYDGKMRTATSVDLTGGAATLVIGQAEEALFLARATLLYTVASSADAGITIEIGKANGTTDRNYYYTGTTTTDQAIWTNTQITLLKTDIVAGDTLTFYSAGGKAGTGEIMCILDFCTM